MSQSAIIGAFGIHSQTGKGVAATSLNWVPATSASVGTQQNTQALAPEVGGSYFLRGAYKAGANVGGDVSVQMRPDSIGNFLYGLCGQDTVTPVPSQSGAYSHVMTPFAPGAGNALPWFTCIMDYAKLYAEQYVDTVISDIRMDVSKQSVTTMTTSLFGITPSEVSVPSTMTEVFDSDAVFVACQGNVDLKNESTGLDISADSNLVERVSLDFQNRVSQDEFVVGSFFPADVTLLQRLCNISYDIVIRDPALVRAVYRNGGSSAWSPTVYRGHLHLTLTSTAVIPTTTQNYQLDIDFPGVDFLMLPVTLSGGQLMRATLTAQVSLGPSGSDTYAFTLVNGTSAY